MRESKKICMFVWNYFTNDARVLRECSALAEAGFNVDLIAIHDINDNNLKRFEKKNGFNIIRVRRYPLTILAVNKIRRFLLNNKILIIPILLVFIYILWMNYILGLLLIAITLLSSTRKIRSFSIKLNIFLQMVWFGCKCNSDIYHSNDLNTLPQGIICSKVLRRKKLIYDSHEVQSSRTGYGKRAYYIEKILIRFMDKMIMTNDTRANYVENLYGIEKPIVVPNYPFYTGSTGRDNKYDLYKILSIPKDKPILLYQGGIQQGRGLENIINSIPYINDGVVVFIGDGKLKKNIIKLVEELGVNEKVRFLDKVPVDELKYYTPNAFLGFQVLNNVCFNHYSSDSNKLFEYIMADVPVVACSFPEIKKVVEGEQIGICIDSHNSKDIANGVNILLEDEKLYERLKANCYKAKVKYNWENEKKKFVAIYN